MTKLVGEWLKTGSTQGIFDAYARNGFRLYFVGGCVRNALLGVDVSDFDMSSDARPDVAQTFLEEAGYRVIPTGIDHGTLTVVAGGIPHEITTFRKDVATDGRRATVSYSDSLEDDARRRDFTINALYADREGEVLDPLNGLPDIAARRVRFIEDPDHVSRKSHPTPTRCTLSPAIWTGYTAYRRNGLPRKRCVFLRFRIPRPLWEQCSRSVCSMPFCPVRILPHSRLSSIYKSRWVSPRMVSLGWRRWAPLIC